MSSTQHDVETRPIELIAEHGRPLTFAQLNDASNGLREPVLLRGQCLAETIDDKWTLEKLLSLDPDASVAAEYYADADRRKPYVRVTKPFRDIAAKISVEPKKWYLAELDFDQVFAKAAPHLPHLSVLPNGAEKFVRLVFFGHDSQSATHFHTKDQAILAHLRGHKTVILAGPTATKDLATNSAFGSRPQFSTHGPEDGADALESFTRIVGNEAFAVEMAPGDALFIPVHWWHWVEGQGECLSVTTFWRASLRNWAWPHPGMRAGIAVVTSQISQIVRRVLGLVTNYRARRGVAEQF